MGGWGHSQRAAKDGSKLKKDDAYVDENHSLSCVLFCVEVWVGVYT